MRLLKLGIQNQAKIQKWGYTDAQIQAFIDLGYIPVASHEDLHAVRTTYSGASKRNFAVGTKWETGEINTTGLAGSYIQVADIDLYDACRTGGAYDNAGAGWLPISNILGNYNLEEFLSDKEKTLFNI